MKKAFSLAEVLIVMVILGIIAALMTSALRSGIPDQDRLMFKKTYSDIVRATSMLANDKLFYRQDEFTKPIFQSPVDAAHIKILADRDHYNLAVSSAAPLDQKNLFCFGMAVYMGDQYYGNECLKPDCQTEAKAGENLRYNFTTANGTRVYGLCGDFSDSHTIYLQVNSFSSPKTDNIKKAYKDDRKSKTPENWKTKWYRLKISPNAKVSIDAVNDELEKLILTESEKK